MDGIFNDIAALMSQQSVEQTQDMELNLIGHVIEYDPKTHMCRALLPTRGAEDDDDEQVMETGWMQVGSGHVGDGHGDQYALKGGATKEEPEKGEQIQVTVQHRHSGLTAVANLTYNDKMRPPGAGPKEEESEEGGEEGGGGGGSSEDSEEEANATDDDEQDKVLVGGERIIRHESGTSIKMYKNGDLGIRSTRDIVLHLNVKGDCKVFLTEGDLIAKLEKGNLDVTLEDGNADLTLELGDATTTLKAGVAETHVELGDALTYVEEGTASVLVEEGDITLETGSGNIAVTATETIDISATNVNILAGIINAGMGIFKQLVNIDFLIEKYNNHVHGTAGGDTTTPDLLGVPGIDTTIDLEAS